MTATTSVSEALKAAKAAAAAPATTITTTVEDTKDAAAIATSAASDAKATTPPPVKPAKKDKEPRIKVDATWLEVLRKKVNAKFEPFLTASIYVADHGKAQIDFTVANNKGSPVSLTPRIVYEDGAIQSPGPKGRLGFCTDKKFDIWFTKVEEKLQVAMERKPRVKGKSPAKQSFWSPIAEKVRVALGDKFAVRSTGGRMTLKENVAEGTVNDWPIQASFKQEEGEVVMSSGKGNLKLIAPIIIMIVEMASEDTTEEEEVVVDVVATEPDADVVETPEVPENEVETKEAE